MALPFVLGAQDAAPPKSLTQVESALNATDRLILVETVEVGRLDSGRDRSTTITAMILTDPSRGQGLARGLRIDFSNPTTHKTYYLDLQEIEPMTKAIPHMIGLLEKWTASPPTGETNAYFNTRGGFYFYIAPAGPGSPTNHYEVSKKYLLDMQALLDKGLAMLR